MEELKKHYLYPGALFFDGEPHQVTTILGSCVSVCLYDKTMNVGGINHYLLPYWNGEGLASPKYGNIAIPKLIEKMIDYGCSIDNLQAKVFGGKGGFGKDSVYKISERNITLAKDVLKENHIRITAESVGGELGRKILFRTDTGEVLMKYLKS